MFEAPDSRLCQTEHPNLKTLLQDSYAFLPWQVLYLLQGDRAGPRCALLMRKTNVQDAPRSAFMGNNPRCTASPRSRQSSLPRNFTSTCRSTAGFASLLICLSCILLTASALLHPRLLASFCIHLQCVFLHIGFQPWQGGLEQVKCLAALPKDCPSISECLAVLRSAFAHGVLEELGMIRSRAQADTAERSFGGFSARKTAVTVVTVGEAEAELRCLPCGRAWSLHGANADRPPGGPGGPGPGGPGLLNSPAPNMM